MSQKRYYFLDKWNLLFSVMSTPSPLHKALNERLRTLISFFFALILSAALLLGETAWHTAPLTEGILMLSGCFFAGIGAFGRIWCSLYIAGYKNTKLIKSGPYARCRNPLYFFSFIGSIGVGLATETYTIPLLIILAFASYYPAIIKKEQGRLREIFGKDYDDYCQEVPSFWPRLFTSAKAPETYVVDPKTFTHNLVDAIWFIWAIGLLEMVEALHDSGILPIFCPLY